MSQLRCVLLATTVALILATACGGRAEIREANASGYGTDFAIVYSEALAAVQERYPNLVDSPRSGVIQTAWHPVNIRDIDGAYGGQPSTASQPGSPTSQFGSNVARTFYFVRFRVIVVGGKPWEVRVEGEASKWQEGAVPVPLRDADVPAWLPGRVDALRVQIHRRLKKHAVPLPKRQTKKKTVAAPKARPSLGEIPAAAAQVAWAVHDAAQERKYEELRKHVAADVVWSAGADPGADQAMIFWQADTSLLARMAEAIAAGCLIDGPSRVVCGANGGPAAVFENVTGPWKLRRFALDE